MTLQSDSMLFPKINKKNFAKPIDKSIKVWYNIITERERTKSPKERK